MKLIFARHGESEANLLHEFSNSGWKHPLTEKGRLQVEILAGRLANQGVTQIFTSPVMRAVQSAEILAGKLGVPYEEAEALREYSVGIWEGSTEPAGWKEYQQVNDAWMLRGEYDRRMQGGESFTEVRERFAGWLGGLVQEYELTGEVFLLVGHGGLYRIMLPEVLVNVSPKFSLEHPLHNTGYVVAEPRAEGLICSAWVADGLEEKSAG
jgi:broad specificity phosphatase PhoE